MPADPELKFLRFWQGIGWLLVLFVIFVTLMPKPPQLPFPDFLSWDKVAHTLVYACLMSWFLQAFASPIIWSTFLLLLGVILEFLQNWFGYRSLEFGDMIANSIGLLAGWLITMTALGGMLASLDHRLAQYRE